jgi:Flp pilus assembly protein CpaB
MEKAKNLVAQLRQDRKILWIAVGSGVLAAMLLYFYLQSQKEPYGRLVPILVAKSDIPKGAGFSEESFREELRPEAFISPEFVGMADLNLIAGKKTVIPIPAGQPILWQYIHLEESAASLSKGLNAQFNERAVAITVDEIKGVGGHIQPRSRRCHWHIRHAGRGCGWRCRHENQGDLGMCHRCRGRRVANGATQ